MIKIKKSEFEKLYSKACSGWKTKFDEKFKTQVFSQDLEFEESFLDEMKSACTNEQLPIFNNIFKQYLKENLFSKIKSYKDVCKELGINELTEKDFKFLPVKDRAKQLAYHKIQNIALLFNGNWKIDWSDYNQYKYYPYFEHKKASGLVFLGSYFVFDCAFCSVAFYKSREISDFVGKIFKDLYEILNNN